MPQYIDENSQSAPVLKSDTDNVQVVNGATSAQSTVFSATRNTVIRLIGPEAFHYSIGLNPTATTSKSYCAANQPREDIIPPNQKVAVIKAAGATNGIVNITPLL